MRWGGNLATGHADAFYVEVTTSPHVGGIDMMRGHTRLDDRIGAIEVDRLPGEVYWTYELETRVSPHSGRLLLDEVRRVDPTSGPPCAEGGR